DKNQIKTNKYLQFDNMKNIFAGGDITDIVEEKTAQSAEKQAKVIIKNILNLDKGIPLVEYIPKKRPMVISLGKTKGIFDTGKFVMNGSLPSLMKRFVEFKTMMKYR